MARSSAKVSEKEIMAINEAASFNPSDLVNTKTAFPLRVGEELWIYTSTLCVSVYIHHYSPNLLLSLSRHLHGLTVNLDIFL